MGAAAIEEAAVVIEEAAVAFEGVAAAIEEDAAAFEEVAVEIEEAVEVSEGVVAGNNYHPSGKTCCSMYKICNRSGFHTINTQFNTHIDYHFC